MANPMAIFCFKAIFGGGGGEMCFNTSSVKAMASDLNLYTQQFPSYECNILDFEGI